MYYICTYISIYHQGYTVYNYLVFLTFSFLYCVYCVHRKKLVLVITFDILSSTASLDKEFSIEEI